MILHERAFCQLFPYRNPSLLYAELFHYSSFNHTYEISNFYVEFPVPYQIRGGAVAPPTPIISTVGKIAIDLMMSISIGVELLQIFKFKCVKMLLPHSFNRILFERNLNCHISSENNFYIIVIFEITTFL